MASPSPAVLLKLLVLEEEREMLARPFSFNLMKGLQGMRGKADGERQVHQRPELVHGGSPSLCPAVFVFQRLPKARTQLAWRQSISQDSK